MNRWILFYDYDYSRNGFGYFILFPQRLQFEKCILWNTECLLIVWRFIAIENTVKDVILIGSNRNDFCFIRICTHIRHHMYTLILQFAVSFDNKFLENCFICFGNRQAAVRMLINDLYRFSSQIRLQQSQEIPTLSHRWSMNFRLSLTLLLFVSL